jgi:hypothetical protein
MASAVAEVGARIALWWMDNRPFSPAKRAERKSKRKEKKARRRAKRRGEEFTSELLPEDTVREDSHMAAYSKLIVMLVGAALTFLSRWFPGLEGADAEAIVEAALLLLTALGVWAVPNKPAQ